MGPCSGKRSPFKNRFVLWKGGREGLEESVLMFLSLSSMGIGERADSRTQ